MYSIVSPKVMVWSAMRNMYNYYRYSEKTNIRKELSYWNISGESGVREFDCLYTQW